MVFFLREVAVPKKMQLSLGRTESISELKLELRFFFRVCVSLTQQEKNSNFRADLIKEAVVSFLP